MKIATTILIALAMFAWGGGSGPKVVEAPPLLRGEGLYTLRYNPAASLSDRMELCAELKGSERWERVALEDPTETETLSSDLQKRFSEKPLETVVVKADLTRRVVTWGSDHGSRVLVLIDLNPPIEAPE